MFSARCSPPPGALGGSNIDPRTQVRADANVKLTVAGARHIYPMESGVAVRCGAGTAFRLTGQIVAEHPVSDFIVGHSAPERKTVFVVCSSLGIGIRIVVECRAFLVGTVAPVV